MGTAMCVAQGATLSDSFETYATGSNIGGANGWVDVSATATQGFMVAATNSSLGSGSRAMHMSDTTNDASLTDARLQNIFTEAVTAAKIEFDFMATTANQTPLLTVRGGTAPTSIQAIIMTITPGGAGFIKYHDGTVWQGFAAGLLLNTWYRFVITVTDVTTGKFDLQVLNQSGEILNQAGLFFRTAVTGLASMDFATNAGLGGSGGDFYIDNITMGPVKPDPVLRLVVIQ
jgi:hypothetical protein